MVTEHAKEDCPRVGLADDWGDRPTGCTGALTEVCSCGRTVFVRWLTHAEWMGGASGPPPALTPAQIDAILDRLSNNNLGAKAGAELEARAENRAEACTRLRVELEQAEKRLADAEAAIARFKAAEGGA